MVFNAVYVKIGNIDDTEDICQEVFIALYNNLEKVDSVRQWLYGTLKNCVLKFYRDRNDNTVDIDTVFADISLTFVNGFRDTRLILESVVTEEVVEEKDRAVFEMVAIHNYSYAHTAGLLGLTKRKIEYRYTQIAKRIQANLAKRGIGSLEELL
jgi:RNA polymerase sigma factor (sigma-70 family)